MPALALYSFSKAIEIPARLHNQPLDAWQRSARLTTLLSRFGIRVLGDLHGRKVVDFAWEKNCGPKTLYELDLLARRAQSQNGKASCNGNRRGCVHASHTPSHGFSATGAERATAKMQQDAASFAIPESICHLSFSELPITTRLADKLRRIDDSLGQFDLALAHVVREAGGQISVAEVYRKLSHPGGRDYRRLTIQNFLWMLRSVECTVVEFKDPEVPTVQLRPSNTGVFPGAVPSQNGKSLTARKIHSNLSAIQLLGTKNGFCERHAVARR